MQLCHDTEMDPRRDVHRLIPVCESHLSLTLCSPLSVLLCPSYVSSSTPSSSGILSPSVFSLLKGRSGFPALMSSTCSLVRCAKELSSTASAERRLNLEKKSETRSEDLEALLSLSLWGFLQAQETQDRLQVANMNHICRRVEFFLFLELMLHCTASMVVS